MNYEEKIGKVVPNDGMALETELGLDPNTIKHEDNFVFKATLAGIPVIITTEPVGDTAESIVIRAIKYDRNTIEKPPKKQKELKLLKITYELKKKNSSETLHINLPVSPKRYAELAKGLSAKNSTWRAVWVTMVKLAQLQDGELGCWHIELEIKMMEDNDGTDDSK